MYILEMLTLMLLAFSGGNIVIDVGADGNIVVTQSFTVSDAPITIAVIPVAAPAVCAAYDSQGNSYPCTYNGSHLLVVVDANTTVTLAYIATNATSRDEGVWTLRLSLPSEATILLPEGAVLIYVSTPPLLVQEVNGRTELLMPSGDVVLQYVFTVELPTPTTTTAKPTTTAVSTSPTTSTTITKTTPTKTTLMTVPKPSTPKTPSTTSTSSTVQVITLTHSESTSAPIAPIATSNTSSTSSTTSTRLVPTRTAPRTAPTTESCVGGVCPVPMTSTQKTSEESGTNSVILIAVPVAIGGVAAALAFMKRARGGSSGSVDTASTELDDRDKAILEAIKKHGGSASAKQIMEATGLPKTTLYRRLEKLVRLGYLKEVRRGHAKLYSLSNNVD